MSDAVRISPAIQEQVVQPVQMQAPHPAKIFEETMYALTRPGVNGRTEFATVYGIWTQDIAQAHMRSSPKYVDYMLPNNMKRDGTAISCVTIAVYECEGFDPAAMPQWARIDDVVIARRTNAFGQFMEKQDPIFVTHSGMIGRDNEITPRVVEAVVTNAAQDWVTTEQLITARTKMPTHKDGIWLRPRSYAFNPGKRVIQILPIVTG